MYIDAVQVKDEIISWMRLPDGSLFKGTDPAPYYCFLNDPNGNLKSMFDKQVRRVDFNSGKEMKDFISSHPDNTWEADISPVYKFLSDNFYQMKDDVPMLNIGLMDIETDYDLEDGRGYPSVADPFGIINALTLYNHKYDTFHVLYVSDYEVEIDDEGDTIIMYRCVNERQLLDTFFMLLDDVDLISGWNSEGFDIPYIHERALLVYGESTGRKKLSRDGFNVKIKDSKDKFSNETKIYTPVGRTHLDFMLLYKKFTFEERSSYKLENIANHELGYGKLDYVGDLGNLYRTDRKKFIEYNIHDVRLLRDLENKKKLIDLAVKMSRQATIKYPDILGTIKYIEGCVRNHAHFDRDEVIVLPNKKTHTGEKFEGAYVVPTKPGLFSWVQSTDLASLYPSVIRILNISPETHLFQCLGHQDDWIKIIQQDNTDIVMELVQDGGTTIMKAFEVYAMLREYNLTISSWGSIFTNEKYGLIPEILSVWYDERKALKKKSQEYAKAGDHVKAAFYDQMQHIRKIALNSAYGALGNAYCRFYSRDTAASVTISGQHINMGQIWKGDQIIKAAIAAQNR